MNQAFFQATLPDLESVMDIRHNLLCTSSGETTRKQVVTLTKLVIAYTKLYRTSLVHDPPRFLKMGSTDSILKAYWKIIQGAALSAHTISSNVELELFPQKLVVQALLLMKATMGDWASKSIVDVSTDFVRQFVDILMTKLMPLTAADLEKWALDPEDFSNEEEADRWEFDLRVSELHT
jgi:hypothetical protein